MNAGLSEFDAKGSSDDEKAPPTAMRYQAGESPMAQARRTKVFALEVRVSGKWGFEPGQVPTALKPAFDLGFWVPY